MRCPSCGHENRPDRKFCGQCGAELAVACASCGTQPEPGERFCGQCGAPLEKAATPSSSTPAPSGQPAAAPPSSFSDGRYQVKSFLGEGGRKRVYLAHDGRLDRDVAIAVIKTEGLDEAGLTRVRREAQAMGRLGDHPHIVTVFDIGEENGEPYIVSQHMAGGELATLIQEAPNQQLPIEDAIRFAGEISDGLQHAHSRGIIHRDIKPGNIWLTEEGTAMIGDFGLAVALDRSRITMAGMMVGTVGYMPPEQALGRDTDASSDLYSLGCVLYEMVTGRTPFTGQDSVAVISQHINTPPTGPSYHNSNVPRVLEALIMRLLAKSPDDRPASAADVAVELRRISTSASLITSVEQPLVVTGAGALQRVPWGRFAGRQEEMSQLKAVLETTLAGQGAIVMLAGEPGIGKTRLAKEFTVYASLRGAQILSGRCFESEGSIPYHPFIQAIQQYVRARPEDELRKELGTDAPEIARMVSEVRQRIPDLPEVPPQEGETDRLRMFDSVSNFIRSAARANPIVLLLDDLQWADKSSLAMLRHIARGIAADRVITLGCYRDVELEENHPLVEALAELRREPFYQPPADTPTPLPTSTPQVPPADTPTPTPSPAPQPGGIDSDGDGCTDAQENGPNEALGGLRDPNDFWDFFDLPVGGSPRNQAVDAFDIGAAVLRFGAFVQPPPTPSEALAQALTPPTDTTSFHAAFDRGGPIPGQNLWNLLPPNGSITAFDIGAVIAQFGHTCASSSR